MTKKKSKKSKFGDSKRGVDSQSQGQNKKRAHRRGTLLRPPGDGSKRFSDGVRSTLKSIRKTWPSPKVRPVALVEKTSVESFVKSFEATYRSIEEHYGGVSPNENLVATVEGIECGETEMPFYQLRAYATHIGLPTGLLLMFTNVMSDATQRHTKASLLNLLECSAAAIGALTQYLRKQDKLELLLFTPIKHTEDGLEYIALLQGLALMSDAFGALRQIELQPETPPSAVTRSSSD